MPVMKNPEKRQKLREELYKSLNSDGVSISQAVKQLRKIMGKSQPEFAEFVSISLSVLRKIEQDAGNVTMHTIKKVLGKFDLELVVKDK